MERRKAPKHREHIQRLLEQYGCDDLEGFLNVTHAVSLNDTFWVRKADSNLSWENVSLYQNEFDQQISEAAFDGSASSSELSTTSPGIWHGRKLRQVLDSGVREGFETTISEL